MFCTEQAALGLAGVSSRKELLDRFDTGSLQFRSSNVRGVRTVRDSRVEYRILEAATCTLAHSVTQRALGSLESVKSAGRTSGAVVPSALRDLRYGSCAGLKVKNVTVRKAFVLLKGLGSTVIAQLGEQCKNDHCKIMHLRGRRTRSSG